MVKKKEAWEANTFDELQSLTTLEEVKRSLRAQETQRLAHKKYYLKRQLILDEAKRRGIDKEVDATLETA